MSLCPESARIPPALIERLERAPLVLVCAHIRPDGDAVGAACGLVRLLRSRGQAAWTLGLEPLPAPVAFVAKELAYTGNLPAPAGETVVMAVDISTKDRLPQAARAMVEGGCPLLIIDHHASNHEGGGYIWVDPSASSAGEMVARLAREAGWPHTAEAADALWVAISSDTGRFANANTTSAALRTAAWLVDGGARPAPLADHMFRSVSWPAMRLAALALARLQRSADGRMAWMGFTRADLAASGAGEEHAQDLIEYPRSIEGVEIAILLREMAAPGTPPQVKASLRTRPPQAALPLAERFGGGGHPLAAGFSVDAPSLEAGEAIILGAAREFYGIV